MQSRPVLGGGGDGEVVETTGRGEVVGDKKVVIPAMGKQH